MQFSKVILGSVMVLFFAGAVFGMYIVNEDHEQLKELFLYIGSPTAIAIGFYAWKAKAENVIKISKDIENTKNLSKSAKERLIRWIAKFFAEESETEE